MKQNYFEEFVSINGIEHYLLHYPKGHSTPVLLYLHGGPGFPEHLHAHILDEAWGDLFTQVHWDQRGAGRTLSKNSKSEKPQSIEQMLNDLNGVVEYLKQHYKTSKIVILGHSWGSLLGSLYALRYPQNVIAYIGSGQVINMMDNEREGYEQARKLAAKAGNQKHIKQLQGLGNYPPADTDELLKLLPKLRKIQESYEEGPGNGSLFKSMLSSPFFKFSDIISMIAASKANEALIPQMLLFDLYKQSRHYEMPVFYILGENDTTTPVSLCKAYFETIDSPDKSITLIPNAWHNPMYEQPDVYTEALKEVIKGLKTHY